MTLIPIIILVIFVIIILAASIRIVQEYERGVVFRLGRYVGVRGPGFILLIPFIERMMKVELRVVTMDVPAQECITLDTVTVKVDAVVYFRVVKPESSVLNVEQYIRATSLLAQTTLRNVVGQSELEDLLAHRDKVNEKLQALIDEGTEPWGIKVSMVEVRDVQMPETMQRAMAAQAEAEREKGQDRTCRRRGAGGRETGSGGKNYLRPADSNATALPANAGNHLYRAHKHHCFPAAHRSHPAFNVQIY